MITDNERIEVSVDFDNENKSHHVVFWIGYLNTYWDGWYAKLKIEEAEKLRDMLSEATREYWNRVNPPHGWGKYGEEDESQRTD
jgi:hypothetical protein